MKVIACCLMVLINISDNGKASLDSFGPTTANILLEDTVKATDKSCYRPCKFNVKPRRCYYKFKIEPIIRDDGQPAITVNGISPGPSINVCINDIIVVEVQNRVPDQDVTLHWHGVEQKGTPHMDGVPMVTQCPIAYGSTYKYAFIASSPGTFFYHTDSVLHQSDGVYGVLVVNQPQPLEPHLSLYDFDRSNENTLIVAAKFPELLTGKLEDLNNFRPTDLIINGNKESLTKLFVLPGYAYRLRLINAIAIECPVIMSVDKHDFLIIASDGKPVKLAPAGKVKLYPGERMDVVVRATQDGGGYWIRVRGTGACAALQATAMFIYSGFNYTSMLLSQGPLYNEADDSDAIYGQMLEALHDAPYSNDIKSLYLGIDRNTVEFKDTDHDFRYISDAIPKKPFFPATLSLQNNGVVQINNKNFLYPNTPILLKPKQIQRGNICFVGDEEKHKDPQCIQIIKANKGEIIELALVNEGYGSNDSYTFHMHGYGMQIVATYQNIDNLPLSKEEFLRRDKNGEILRNIINPPIKDTITIPNKGYTIIRIKTDRGGSWLLECRSCSVSSLPAAVLVNIPQSIAKPVIESLPKCGNYRPADVLLN